VEFIYSFFSLLATSKRTTRFNEQRNAITIIFINNEWYAK